MCRKESGALCEKHIGIWRIYAIIQSFKRISGKNQRQSARDGTAGRSIQAIISQIERGDYSPSVTLALKIAKVFEVPVEAIFTYEEESEEEK